LIIPSAIGFLAALVTPYLNAMPMPEFVVGFCLVPYGLALLIESIAVPVAVWKLSSAPEVRIAKNLLSTAVGAVFLLFEVLKILLPSVAKLMLDA